MYGNKKGKDEKKTKKLLDQIVIFNYMYIYKIKLFPTYSKKYTKN